MQKSPVSLAGADKEALEVLLHQQGVRSSIFKRVTALLALNKGKTITSVCDTLGVFHPTVTKLVSRYHTAGLGCLQDKKQRPVVRP